MKSNRENVFAAISTSATAIPLAEGAEPLEPHALVVQFVESVKTNFPEENVALIMEAFAKVDDPSNADEDLVEDSALLIDVAEILYEMEKEFAGAPENTDSSEDELSEEELKELQENEFEFLKEGHDLEEILEDEDFDSITDEEILEAELEIATLEEAEALEDLITEALDTDINYEELHEDELQDLKEAFNDYNATADSALVEDELQKIDQASEMLEESFKALSKTAGAIGRDAAMAANKKQKGLARGARYTKVMAKSAIHKGKKVIRKVAKKAKEVYARGKEALAKRKQRINNIAKSKVAGPKAAKVKGQIKARMAKKDATAGNRAAFFGKQNKAGKKAATNQKRQATKAANKTQNAKEQLKKDRNLSPAQKSCY